MIRFSTLNGIFPQNDPFVLNNASKVKSIIFLIIFHYIVIEMKFL